MKPCATTVHPHLPRLAACLLALLLAAPATAEIYKRVLPDGTIVFSDEPSPGAEVVELPPLQTVPAAPLIRPASPASPPRGKTIKVVPYRVLAIAAPRNDQQIRENSGRVVVAVNVQPPLQVKAGHRLVLKMDGKAVASTTEEPRFVLENVDRGSHELRVEIQDSKGRTVKTSPPVVFHLFRFSRLLAPRLRN